MEFKTYPYFHGNKIVFDILKLWLNNILSFSFEITHLLKQKKFKIKKPINWILQFIWLQINLLIQSN